MGKIRLLFDHICLLLLSCIDYIQFRGIEAKRKKSQKSFKIAPVYFLLGNDWKIKGSQYIKGQAGCHLRIEALYHINGRDYQPDLKINI